MFLPRLETFGHQGIEREDFALLGGGPVGLAGGTGANPEIIRYILAKKIEDFISIAHFPNFNFT